MCSKFKYLGSIVTRDVSSTKDVNTRIAIDKAAFTKGVLLTSKLKLETKKKLVKFYLSRYVERKPGTSGERIEIPGTFQNMVLYKKIEKLNGRIG